MDTSKGMTKNTCNETTESGGTATPEMKSALTVPSDNKSKLTIAEMVNGDETTEIDNATSVTGYSVRDIPETSHDPKPLTEVKFPLAGVRTEYSCEKADKV